MNRVTLLGRLTKDPEIRYTPTGKRCALFTLAINRPYQNANKETEADFINCVVWNQGAGIIEQYVKKGHRLLCEGSIRTRSYERDGQRRYITEIIVSNFTFIESAKKQEEANQATAAAAGFDTFGSPVDVQEEIPF